MTDLPVHAASGGPTSPLPGHTATLSGPPTATRGIFDADLLSACISCGFCLPACPTYALSPVEKSSPRGRITLMRALEEGRLDPDDPTLQEQAGECLGCRACETVCPAGVQYGVLLEQWRDHQWRGRHTPPIVAALRAGMHVRPALRLGGIVRRATATTGPAQPGKPHLMLGCVESTLFPKVSEAAKRLVPEADVPAGQGCCGALHAHNGSTAGGERFAHALGATMRVDAGDVILTTAGGCAAHIAQELGRDSVVEISDYLHRAWTADPSRMPRLRPLLVDGRPARVGLQDSCHLRNALGVTEAPRALIKLVADYVELPSAGSCCGAAGSYSLLQPARSKRLLRQKVSRAQAADVDYLVVVNPGCQMQLATGMRSARTGIPVLHIVELLAKALD